MKRLACLFTLVVSILILGHSALAFSAVGDEEAMNTSRAKEGSDEGYGIISGNVALTSDYVFRGQSQTDHQPAIQGGLDWAGPYGIYVGAWALTSISRIVPRPWSYRPTWVSIIPSPDIGPSDLVSITTLIFVVLKETLGRFPYEWVGKSSKPKSIMLPSGEIWAGAPGTFPRVGPIRSSTKLL